VSSYITKYAESYLKTLIIYLLYLLKVFLQKVIREKTYLLKKSKKINKLKGIKVVLKSPKKIFKNFQIRS
jgi:hypothetical protein